MSSVRLFGGPADGMEIVPPRGHPHSELIVPLFDEIYRFPEFRLSFFEWKWDEIGDKTDHAARYWWDAERKQYRHDDIKRGAP